ncbi:Uncharacterised protein [Shigella sonnei]|nr:Uncharacterised protein [Shigella sonnei]
MLTEELTALARFHQFDETQLDRAMLDPVQKGVELVMINITHQHGIDFDLLKTDLKCSIDPCHDLVEFILPGNSVKLAGVQTVDTDVNASKSRIAPVRHIAFQTVTIGGDRNLADSVVFPHSGDDIGKVAA